MFYVWTIVYILIFIMGAFYGSFSTLAIYRLPRKLDITHERSFCPNCGHKLGFLDLFPLFSFLFLRGKCRYCGQKISVRYFWIEFCFGIFAVLLFSLIIKIRIVLDFWTLIIFVLCMSLGEVIFLVVSVRIIRAHCNVPLQKK